MPMSRRLTWLIRPLVIDIRRIRRQFLPAGKGFILRHFVGIDDIRISRLHRATMVMLIYVVLEQTFPSFSREVALGGKSSGC